MQFSELRAMSLWQFDQIFRGWRQANMSPETPPPTQAEFEAADWNW